MKDRMCIFKVCISCFLFVCFCGLIVVIVRRSFTMERFELVSEYEPTGDQPQAIEAFYCVR